MGPKTGLDVCGKFRPHQDSIPFIKMQPLLIYTCAGNQYGIHHIVTQNKYSKIGNNTVSVH